jgi:hypothetical protein
MADDPTIPDDAIIWRCVVPQWVVPGRDGEGVRPSTGAFDDSSDADPMSAVLASGERDPKSVIPTTRPNASVVAFTAKALRDLGLELERAPEPDEPHHILVRGPKTKAVKKALSRSARWVVEGERVGVAHRRGPGEP